MEGKVKIWWKGIKGEWIASAPPAVSSVEKLLGISQRSGINPGVHWNIWGMFKKYGYSGFS